MKPQTATTAELTPRAIAHFQWAAFARNVRERAERLQRARHDRAWRLAATVGIPRDGCCLHNAAIDTELKGWCFQNPERLRVAKRANYLLDDWSITRMADRIISRAYDKVSR